LARAGFVLSGQVLHKIPLRIGDLMDKEQSQFFKRFGAVVRKFRLSKKMTLEDMQAFDFSAQHFQKIESGKKAVGLYTAQRIAKAFGLTLSSLIKQFESEK
jgi:hypothetical protein